MTFFGKIVFLMFFLRFLPFWFGLLIVFLAAPWFLGEFSWFLRLSVFFEPFFRDFCDFFDFFAFFTKSSIFHFLQIIPILKFYLPDFDIFLTRFLLIFNTFFERKISIFSCTFVVDFITFSAFFRVKIREKMLLLLTPENHVLNCVSNTLTIAF